MVRLSARAREDFEAAGIDAGDVAEVCWGSRDWRGDTCGCTDDRCIGHHHDGEDCGCRPVVIQKYLDEIAAAEQAIELWARYVVAQGEDVDVVRQDVADWVDRFHRGAPSWSLDDLVAGRPGISVTSLYNDQRHLVWAAPYSL